LKHYSHDAVERIENPTREEFERVVSRKSPVIITGLTRDWPALSLWNLDYFNARLGQQPVRVTYCPTGVNKEDHHYTKMPMAQYIDLISSTDQKEGRHYISGIPLEKLEALRGDYHWPGIVPPNAGNRLALFFVGRSSVTGYHFHPYDEAILTQITGKKKIILCEPDQLAKMYAYPALNPFYRWSRVDPEHPDPESFPAFRDIKPLVCEIQAGEMLFIPLHWWHAVYGPELSMSVTFFWAASIRQYRFPDPGWRCLTNWVLHRYPRVQRVVRGLAGVVGASQSTSDLQPPLD